MALVTFLTEFRIKGKSLVPIDEILLIVKFYRTTNYRSVKTIDKILTVCIVLFFMIITRVIDRCFLSYIALKWQKWGIWHKYYNFEGFWRVKF